MRKIYFSYGTQLAGTGLGFLWVTLITKHSGLAMLGVISILNAFSGILSNILDVRSVEGVTRFYRQGVVDASPSLCRVALLFGLILDLIIGCVLLAVVWALSPYVAIHLLKDPALQPCVEIFSFVMFCSLIRGTAGGMLYAKEQFYTLSAIPVCEQAIKLFLLACAMLFGVPVSAMLLVQCMLAASVCMTLFIYFRPFFELFGTLGNVSISRREYVDYVKFCLNTFASSLLRAGTQHMDSIILGYMLSPAAVGLLNLFKQFLNPMLMISSPYGQLLPRFIQAKSEGKFELIDDAISGITHKLLRIDIIIVPLLTILFILYSIFIDIDIGVSDVGCFLLFSISFLIMQTTGWWGKIFPIAFNPVIAIVSAAILSICTLLVLPAGVYIFGFFGVIVSALLSSTVNILYLYYIYKKYKNLYHA